MKRYVIAYANKKTDQYSLYTINAKSPVVITSSGIDSATPIVPYAQNSSHNNPIVVAIAIRLPFMFYDLIC